jgi:AcrR family transcriptional regulator
MTKEPSAARKGSEERAERQRARIMEAAKEAFAEHGYHAASMSTIAKKAGVSQGLAYCYFESKYAIFEATLNAEMRLFWDSFKDIHTRADFIDRTLACISSMYDEDGKPYDPVLYLEIRVEATRNPDVARALKECDDIGDKIYKDTLRNLYLAEGYNVSDATLRERIDIIDMLFDGFQITSLRSPKEDMPARLALLRRCMEHALDPASEFASSANAETPAAR